MSEYGINKIEEDPLLVISMFSDFHIEKVYPTVPDYKNYIKCSTDIDVLILAGDIGRLEYFDQFYKFIESVCRDFKRVIFVAGNHEYYFYSKLADGIVLTLEQCKVKLKSISKTIKNFIVLDDETFEINGVCIIGSTLWGKIHQQHYYRKLPIFTQSNNNKDEINYISHESLSLLNIKAEKFIIENLKLAKQKLQGTIVVTHYSPNPTKASIRYSCSPEKEYYYSDMRKYLNCATTSIWISGHTHINYITVNDMHCTEISNCAEGKEYINDLTFNIDGARINSSMLPLQRLVAEIIPFYPTFLDLYASKIMAIAQCFEIIPGYIFMDNGNAEHTICTIGQGTSSLDDLYQIILTTFKTIKINSTILPFVIKNDIKTHTGSIIACCILILLYKEQSYKTIIEYYLHRRLLTRYNEPNFNNVPFTEEQINFIEMFYIHVKSLV